MGFRPWLQHFAALRLVAMLQNSILQAIQSYRPKIAIKSPLLGLVIFFCFAACSECSEIDDVKSFYRTGDYGACIQLAAAQVEKGVWNELWPRMLIESYLVTGDYPAALRVYEKALERFDEADAHQFALIGLAVNSSPCRFQPGSAPFIGRHFAP